MSNWQGRRAFQPLTGQALAVYPPAGPPGATTRRGGARAVEPSAGRRRRGSDRSWARRLSALARRVGASNDRREALARDGPFAEEPLALLSRGAPFLPCCEHLKDVVAPLDQG